MFSTKIKTLLQEKLPGLPYSVCSRSLRHDIDALVAEALGPMKLAVIDDRHTGEAFGDRVFKALKGRFPTTHVTLPPFPQADDVTADYLRTQTLSCDALVAVGSGTLGDLCKYVSHMDDKPYVIFPTAASMNGYGSGNASITVNGYKKTLTAHMPKAIFCDLSVIAAAPARLSKAGLGDALARPTAQADWLLSHILLGTPYDETPFQLQQDIEPQLFDSARGIALADPPTIELLTQLCILSGFGMAIAGGSQPASGGEHMIAHAMEMSVECGVWSMEKKILPNSKLQTPTTALHGEAVGVTTLTMARMQEQLLSANPRLHDDDFPDAKIKALYGEQRMLEAKKAFAKKQAAIANLASWQSAVEKITSIMLPSAKLQSILEAAQAPTTPHALGWDDKTYAATVETARFLRDRFGFLDIENA
jgi:glycerol-1-phosphate dehydrogenase [NAD(P)+]